MAHPKFFIFDVDESIEGMDFNSLVDFPAHMKGFIAFGEDGKIREYEFKQYFNEEQRIVTGVAIATNLPIKRHDEENGDYYGVFTAESAKKIWIKMMENGYLHNVNEMHDSNKNIKGMVLFESFIVDKANGIFPEHFKDQNLKDGSIIVSYLVKNDEAWEDIKSGKVKGFSVEGWFKKVPMKMKGEVTSDEKFTMAKISQINTWEIEVLEEAIDFGTVLHIGWKKEDGTLEDGWKLQSGEYLSPDRKKIMVDSAGTVVMIDGKTKEQMSQIKKQIEMNKKTVPAKSLMKRLFGKEKFETATTVDGVVLSWEGELTEGTEVKVPAANEGEAETLAPEGDHTIPGSEGKMKIITIDGNGKATAITEVDATAQSAEVEQAMRKIIADNKTAMAKVETDHAKAFTDLDKKYQDKFAEFTGMMTEMAQEIDAIKGDGGSGKKKFHREDSKEPGYRILLKKAETKA
jgi:hypothetical protein